MKYLDFSETKGTQKYSFGNKMVRPSDLSFRDFYEDTARNWEEKARRLQLRRWRKIKHNLA